MNSTLLLYVCLSNPARSALIANMSNPQPPATPEFVLRDTVTLRVRFYERADDTGLLDQVDIGEDITLSFGGKKSSEIISALMFLFFTNALVRVVDGDDIYWEGDLDLNTVEFLAAFGAEATVGLTCELEVSEGAQRRTVAQFVANGIYDVIRGGEAAATPSTPPLPSAPIADTLLGGNSAGNAWQQRTASEVKTLLDIQQSNVSGLPTALLGKRSLAAYTAHSVATSNVAALTGLPEPDSTTLTVGQVILLVAQSTGHQNGPWVVAAGAWTRPDWYPAAGTVQAFENVTVHVTLGYDYGNTFWRCDTSGVITIGTTATAWAGVRATSGVSVPVFIDDFFYAETLQDFIQYVNDRYYELPNYGEVSTEIAAANVASGARTSLGTLSTAGNTDLTVASTLTRRRYYEVTIGAGSAAFTRTLTALTANAQAGDGLEISVTMPAGVFPTVELRNATSGGTLLATVPADALASRVWTLWSRYNGTAWGAATVTPRNVVADYVAPLAVQRMGSDQIISSGSGTGSAQIQIPGSRGNFAGAAVATWRGVVTVPSVAPSASGYVFLLNSIAGAETANSIICYLFPTGKLSIAALGTGGFTNSRDFSFNGFQATYGGRTDALEVLLTQGTTNPVVRWGDVNISANFVASSVGSTPPAWLDAALVSTYHVTGYNWPANQPAPVGCWINAALSDADRAYWRATGKPPLWVLLGNLTGNQISDISRNSDFSAGATDWTINGGGTLAVVSGQLSMSGGLNWAGPPAGFLTGGTANRMYRSGSRGRVSFDFISGAATTMQVWIGGLAASGVVVPVAGQRCVIEWTNAVDDAPIRLRANGDWIIDNVVFEGLGAVSIPLIQRGGVIGDATYMGDNPARLVGMRAITDKKDFIWTATVDTASTGNKQLLGGAVFMDPLQIAIDSIDRDGTGTETASVGDGTTATRFTASAARSAARQRLTLTEYYPADAAKTGLYYDITGAGAAGTKAKLTVRGHVIP